MRIAIGALALLACATLAHAEVIYVDIDAVGANNGTSWMDAYVDLQDALGAAAYGDDVWVAEGRHVPTAGHDWQATFSVPSGVRLHGGFAGNETSIDERDWELRPTILSGDLGLEPDYQQVSEYVVTLTEADSTTTVSGFTISGGRHGMRVSGGLPRIEDALITENRIYGGGSGAGADITDGAAPVFLRVRFTRNWAPGGAGGGMLVSPDSRATIREAEFANNSATSYGGAISGPAELTDVLIAGNWAAYGAGGLNLAGPGPLTRVRFEENLSDEGPGGMSGRGVLTDVQFLRNRGSTIGYSSPGGALVGGGQLTSVVFAGNQCNFGGGAMYDPVGGSVLVNVLFHDNDSGPYGGGALWVGEPPHSQSGTPDAVKLVNCTLSRNRAGEGTPEGLFGGGTIHCRGGELEVYNSILWENSSDTEVALDGAVGSIGNSLVGGSGGSGPAWDSALGADLGHNIDLDPLFLHPTEGDFHLSPCSEAQDMGDLIYSIGLTRIDLDGNPRHQGQSVDLGVYENPPPGWGPVVYVNADADGGNCGGSWQDAFTDLQDALAVARRGQEVWVAEGVYKPTAGIDQSISFRIPSGAGIYGGFAGNESARDDRDWVARPTILSGDIGEPMESVEAPRATIPRPDEGAAKDEFWRWREEMRVSFASASLADGRWDNSIRVVSAVSVDESTVLDGFTITCGGSGGLGGGMVLEHSSPTIRNCSIKHNSNAHWGAGAHITAGEPTFESCLFESNYAGHVGGAIAMQDAGLITLLNTDFVENYGLVDGGAVNAGNAHVVMHGGSFVRNSSSEGIAAISSGGKVELDGVSVRENESHEVVAPAVLATVLTMESCEVVGNYSIGWGWAAGAVSARDSASINNTLFALNETVFWWDMNHEPQNTGALVVSGSLNLTNSTFVGNSADLVGAIQLTGSDPSLVANTIIWGNDGALGPDGLLAASPQVLIIKNSLVQGSGGSGSNWNPALGVDGGGNLDANPLFVDVMGGNFRLAEGSPAIDAGDTYAVPPGVTTDLDGNPRFMRSAVDMGAYEADGPLSLDDPDPVPQPKNISQYLHAAPNPFNPSTTIYYGVPDAGYVTLAIYDMAGRKVKSLVAEHVSAGDHEVNWDGRDEAGRRVASGVYLYRLRAGEFVESKRMVLVK